MVVVRRRFPLDGALQSIQSRPSSPSPQQNAAVGSLPEAVAGAGVSAADGHLVCAHRVPMDPGKLLEFGETTKLS